MNISEYCQKDDGLKYIFDKIQRDCQLDLKTYQDLLDVSFHFKAFSKRLNKVIRQEIQDEEKMAGR